MEDELVTDVGTKRGEKGRAVRKETLAWSNRTTDAHLEMVTDLLIKLEIL